MAISRSSTIRTTDDGPWRPTVWTTIPVIAARTFPSRHAIERCGADRADVALVFVTGDAHARAGEALEIVRRGEPIDLILTDIVMPGGKTGVHLAAEARALRPDIKVLLTSGYPGEALARHEPIDIEWPMIAKPFRQPELATRLQSLLEGRVERVNEQGSLGLRDTIGSIRGRGAV